MAQVRINLDEEEMAGLERVVAHIYAGIPVTPVSPPAQRRRVVAHTAVMDLIKRFDRKEITFIDTSKMNNEGE